MDPRMASTPEAREGGTAVNWWLFFAGFFGAAVWTSLIIMNSHLGSISRSLRDINDRMRHQQTWPH
jgi:uncharacterized membrane protein YdcZ (DUF606 family)